MKQRDYEACLNDEGKHTFWVHPIVILVGCAITLSSMMVGLQLQG